MTRLVSTTSAGKAGMVIGTSYLVMALIDPNSGLWQLPLQWVLKNRLGLSAGEVSAFFAIALSPWYFKPLAGLLSDAVPLRGSRRRNYLLLGSVAAALGCAVLAFIPPTKQALLPVCFLLHMALMLVSTVTGGVLVEEGQKGNTTGALTSLRSTAESLAALSAAPLGGWLAGKALGGPAAIGTTLALGMVIIFARFAREPVSEMQERNHARRALRSIGKLLTDRRVWIVSALFICYQIAPGFQTPLFFYQTDTLHFTGNFIGLLGLVSSVASIAGAGFYGVICRKLAFRFLFPLCVASGVLITTGYAGYQSAATALLIEGSNGLFGTMALVALFDLIARNMPTEHEALGYAMVFSIGNLASSISDLIGSTFFDEGTPFTSLVWLNAGTTGLIVLTVPFIGSLLQSGARGEGRAL